MENIKSTGFVNIENANHCKLIEYFLVITKSTSDNDSYKVRYKNCEDKLKNGMTITRKFQNYDICLRYHDPNYQINCIDKTNTADIFRLLHNIKNKYYQYNQQYYLTSHGLIKTIIENNNVWFDLYQISNILQYAKSNYLSSYYSTHHCINTKTLNKHDYTDKEGLMLILTKSRKPESKTLLTELGLNTTNKIQSYEEAVLDNIIDFLSETKIEYKLQYAIGNYRVDMYIPNYKIVIEVDEMGHMDRDQVYELKREKYIRDNLTNKILRINPNVPNFRITKEIAKLNIIMQSALALVSNR